MCPGSTWQESDTYSSRGGDLAVENWSLWCDAVPQDDAVAHHAIELYAYEEDPTDYWEERIHGGFDDRYASYALGRAEDGRWYMLFEDDSANEIADPYAPVLEEFGFDVYVNA